ncbi:MAG: sensor histidine kinase, partial [Hymenobacter sp.]|nr:sensor histidine kinase [Hymenobacter sp.]
MTLRSLLERYPQRELRVLAHLLFWGMMYPFTEDPNEVAPVLSRLLALGYAMASFYVLFYGPVPRWWAQRRYAGPALVLLGLVLGSGWVMYWQNVLPRPHSTYQFVTDFRAYGVLAIFLSGRAFFYAVFNGLLLSLVAPGVLKIAKTLYERQLLRQRTEQLTRRGQLDALLSQVSPHFLFNTLNNLYGLVLQADPSARPIARQLAALVRYCDEAAGRPWVTLRAEAQFIEDYLALARLRYGQLVRIESAWHLGAAVTAQVPPLLLLPLVENACKHGLSQAIGAAWVRVSAEVAAGELIFTVANSRADGDRPATTRAGGL